VVEVDQVASFQGVPTAVAGCDAELDHGQASGAGALVGGGILAVFPLATQLDTPALSALLLATERIMNYLETG
jgi:hypothetical protein